MITVGGFNTALDRLLEVEAVRPGTVNRARRVRVYPGGKGLHVALTLAALGERVRLVGIIDRTHRALFAQHLQARGIEFCGVEVRGDIRTNLAIRDDAGGVTEVLEPGPLLDDAEGRQLAGTFLNCCERGGLAVLSGSLPAGLPDTTYADLVTALAAGGCPCIVDASGHSLACALNAAPFMMKPNRDEAGDLLGWAVRNRAAAAEAATTLARRGVRAAVVSLGEDGAVASWDGTLYEAVPPPVGTAANTVGAGDSLVGGLAAGVSRGWRPADALRLGIACGTAATMSAEIGQIRRTDVDALLPAVRVSIL